MDFILRFILGWIIALLIMSFTLLIRAITWDWSDADSDFDDVMQFVVGERTFQTMFFNRKF